MRSVFANFVALFVFTMTVSGIISAVGTSDMAQYDIAAAAELLQTIYLKAFGVPQAAAGPASYILLALPGVLAFYTIQAIFGGNKQS